MRLRLAIALACVALVLGSCGLDVVSNTATPMSTPSVSASEAVPTATEAPTPTPSPTPEPTPDQADVPLFEAGVQLKTVTTVRLRDLPGTNWGTSANLPSGALVQAVLGPIRTDGYGWYLVRDADPADPAFLEGWVAAGFEPDPFLAATGATPRPEPQAPTFVAGYAQTTSGDFGPFRVEGSTALRWAVALPPGAPPSGSCSFTGSLKPGGSKAVVFATTTVSRTPDPGTTQPTFFAQHDSLKGDLVLHVESDCSWAVTVVRLPI